MERRIKINQVWFGKYEILQLIGNGGSATVYLARHIKLQSYRAIKCIKKEYMIYEQLINEARILKNLRHPSIPIIYDIEEDTNYSYIIEEFLEGQSLKAYRLCQGNIPEDIIINFALQVCDLFQYLHKRENPILYLDLKPDNIVVSGQELKLIDFGTAVYSKEVDNRKISLGTKGYAAPEQYGLQPVDLRSDIYGTGMLLLFLITGEEKLSEKEKLKILDRDKYYSKKLKRIIFKCLKVYPSQRFQSIIELRNKLLAVKSHKNKPNMGLINTSLTIALAGSQSRVGTTHVAFMLASYLNCYCDSAIYVENNDHLIIPSILNCCDNIRLIDGVFYNHRCPMWNGSPFCVPEYLDKYKIKVCDYGVFCQDMLEEFEKADIKLIIVGTKEWELDYTYKCLGLLQKSNPRYLFNYTSSEKYLDIVCNFGKMDCARVPYHSNPFVVKQEGIVKDFVEDCVKELL